MTLMHGEKAVFYPAWNREHKFFLWKRPKMKQNANHQRVYSSEEGRICPNCDKAKANCLCGKKASGQQKPSDGVIRIGRETKGRKGKGVTLISGVPSESLVSIAKELKQLCGSGGTVKDGRIEIQGDHRDTILSFFVKKGFMAKKAGG